MAFFIGIGRREELYSIFLKLFKKSVNIFVKFSLISSPELDMSLLVR